MYILDDVQYLGTNDTLGGDPISIFSKKGSKEGSASALTINETPMRLDVTIVADQVLAGGQSVTLTPSMETSNFGPLVFLDVDGCTYLHNYADGNQELVERVEDYAFTGEQVICDVLVVDKNGVPEKVEDVYMTASMQQDATPDDIEANCNYVGWNVCHEDRECTPATEFNARIGQEELNEWKQGIMGVYSCIFTVESEHQGEYWISVVAEDIEGDLGIVDEQNYVYLNPEIALEIIGGGYVDFGLVSPGVISYADTIAVMNAAPSESGVLMNIFISGSDFYDNTNSGAKCPNSNVLALSNFGYYASNGAYRTVPGCSGRSQTWFGGIDEGYYTIPYETGDEGAREEIIECAGAVTLGGLHYEAGNVLSPGADIAITFALALPEPCNGEFTDGGSFMLWAEAI